MELNQEIYEKLKRYPYLCNMYLERETEKNYNFSLKLVFCDFFNHCMDDRLLIIFSDVQSLEMKNLDGLLRAYIIVRDLSDRQLENINYYVKESEEDMFSFYCSSIEVKTSHVI